MAIEAGGEPDGCGVLETEEKKYFREKRLITVIRSHSLGP